MVKIGLNLVYILSSFFNSMDDSDIYALDVILTFSPIHISPIIAKWNAIKIAIEIANFKELNGCPFNN